MKARGLLTALAIVAPLTFGGSASAARPGDAPHLQGSSRDACPYYPSPVICGSESQAIEMHEAQAPGHR